MKKLFDGGVLVGIGMLIIFVGMTVLGLGVAKVNKAAEEKHERPKIHVLVPYDPEPELPPSDPPHLPPAPPPPEEKREGTWWWPF